MIPTLPLPISLEYSDEVGDIESVLFFLFLRIEGIAASSLPSGFVISKFRLVVLLRVYLCALFFLLNELESRSYTDWY